MSLSKNLASAIAAVTVAGAVGLAYAQSTPDTTKAPAPANADTSQPVNNTAPSSDSTRAPSSSTSSMPSSTTTTTTTDTSSTAPSTDLAPKADRN